MAFLDPDEAATIAQGSWAVDRPVSPLTSFSIDTRTLEPGETFVALRSPRADGHAFLNQAYRYRAAAALVEKPDEAVPIPQLVVRDSLQALQSLALDWRRRFHGPVIGITGSYGKTTVKEMLGTVLGTQWFRTRGNYNNHIGVPLSLLELDPRRHAGGILEAGINDCGEMDLLAGLIRPDMAIITAVGPAHLERLGSLEGVAREKALLAKAVGPGGHVFLPAELLGYAPFREIARDVRIHALLGPGQQADRSWEAMENVTIYHYDWTETTDSRGTGELTTCSPMAPGNFSFRAGSPGMVSNLALVVHTLLHLGVPADTLQVRLDAWQPYRQRGEIIHHGETVFYVDCYNANPGSMLDSARRFAKSFPDRRHAYVIGSMNELGGEAAFWHRQTAREMEIQEGAPLYLVGEWAGALADGFLDRGIAAERIHTTGDLSALKAELAAFAGAVFLKGSRSLGLETILPEGGDPAC